jgi:hypothetical protein
MSGRRGLPLPFGHCAGAILGDGGPLTLAAARALAVFYWREGQAQTLTGAPAWGRLCAARAACREGGTGAASAWRRAAGGQRREDADGAPAVALRPPAAPPGHRSA